MLAPSRARPILLLHAEPELDCADPAAARAALGEGRTSSLCCRRSGTARRLRRRAAAGRAVHRDRRHVRQLRRPRTGFNGVVKPLGEARPAWKVLRVLGIDARPAGIRLRQRSKRCARELPRRTSRRLSTRRDSSNRTRPAQSRRRQRARWRRARRRRADLFRRSAGAPRAVAAEDAPTRSAPRARMQCSTLARAQARRRRAASRCGRGAARRC